MKISNESKVGIFTAITIVLLILGYNYLRGKDLFTRTNTYYVVYEDAEGINTSTPVLVNGLKVGQVTGVQYVDGDISKVKVEMEVRKDVGVKSTDSAKLFDIPLSGKSIKIMVGKNGTPAKDGDVLVPAVEPSLLASLSKTIVPFRDKAESIMSSLDTLLGEGTQKELHETFNRINRTLANIEAATAKNSEIMTRLNSIMANADAITSNLKNNNAAINKVIKNLGTVSDSIAQIHFAEVIAKTTQTVDQLNTIMEKINSGTGTLGALVYNDELYNNLKNDAASLDALLKDLKENPGRYVHISVFGKKEKAPKKKKN